MSKTKEVAPIEAAVAANVIAKRYVVEAGGATPYPVVQGIEGIVAVEAGPVVTPYVPGEVPPPGTLYYDAVFDPNAVKPAKPIKYHAEMHNDGTVTIKKDTFTAGSYGHTFAGWPIPGVSITPV
jgi:hypothetical protein